MILAVYQCLSTTYIVFHTHRKAPN